MKMKQYTDFQDLIMKNLDNKNKIHEIIQKNENLINEIIQNTGSGNSILAKPYDYLYEHSLYEMASFYQTELEQVNEVALFGEDG
jgi:hypothetical protein